MTDLLKTLAAAAAAGALALASACGSTAPADGEANTAPVANTADTPGAEEAAAYLADYTENPTDIGLTEALPAEPEAGKSVIYLQTPGAVSERSDQANKAAAEALGWEYGTVDTGLTPSTAVGAFQAAIARRPDAIIFAGYPAALFTEEVRQANAAGITVVSNATGDAAVEGVLADLGGKAQEEIYGRVMAALFVVESGGTGQAVVFNIGAYPILTQFVDAFETAVEEWCPDCRTETVDQQLTDVGAKTPSNVVGYLQRNPDVKWAVFSNGDLSQGVSAAINSAGLTGVNIIGEVPTEANLANLAAGTEKAWAGYAVDILGWRMMDLLARHFQDADVPASVAVPLPVQVITDENVSEVVTDGGYYVGVDGYQDQFQQLWNVG